MKESNILVSNVAYNSLRREVLLNTKGHYMKESNTIVGNATIKQSNTPVGIAANDSMMRQLLQNTKGKYMKESNTLADNATRNIHEGEILLDT